MPGIDQLKHQHLLWRAGFGPKAGDFQNDIKGIYRNWYDRFAAGSSTTVKELDALDPYLKELIDGGGRKMLSEDERRMVRRRNRDGIKKLNLSWLNEMVNGEQQLREKVSLFWHGHFACRSQNIIYQQALVNTIRKN